VAEGGSGRLRGFRRTGILSLVDPDDTQRRTLFLPVLLAAVLLAVIGASVGSVMAYRAGSRITPAVPTSPAPSSSSGVVPPAYPVRALLVNGEPVPCRPQTQKAAKKAGAFGVLNTVLAVDTATWEIWVCLDGNDKLYLHRRASSTDDQGWVEGRTATLLTDVSPHGGGFRGVERTADGAVVTWDVDPDVLVIGYGGMRTVTEPTSHE
jgi:hypothetical protein